MAIALLAASMGLSLAGGLMSAKAANDQGVFNQYVANYNARVLENDAVRVRQVGNEKENDVRRAGAELGSRQRAAFGAAGVEVDAGSAARVQHDTKVLANVDAMRVRRSTDMRVERLNQEAVLSRAGGRNAAKVGRANMIGSLLSTGSQFAGSAYKNKVFG